MKHLDYAGIIKKFTFPVGYMPPAELAFEDIVAKPLTRKDVLPDMQGVNSSLELIRKTRGGSWPAHEVTEEEDLLDLAWHEREFFDGSSFAYAVYNAAGEYIGCFYLYQMGYRTDLTEELATCDMDASWWVTSAAYEQGYYDKLYRALRKWLNDFPVNKIYYSNKQIPEY